MDSKNRPIPESVLRFFADSIAYDNAHVVYVGRYKKYDAYYCQMPSDVDVGYPLVALVDKDGKLYQYEDVDSLDILRSVRFKD